MVIDIQKFITNLIFICVITIKIIKTNFKSLDITILYFIWFIVLFVRLSFKE